MEEIEIEITLRSGKIVTSDKEETRKEILNILDGKLLGFPYVLKMSAKIVSAKEPEII